MFAFAFSISACNDAVQKATEKDKNNRFKNCMSFIQKISSNRTVSDETLIQEIKTKSEVNISNSSSRNEKNQKLVNEPNFLIGNSKKIHLTFYILTSLLFIISLSLILYPILFERFQWGFLSPLHLVPYLFYLSLFKPSGSRNVISNKKANIFFNVFSIIVVVDAILAWLKGWDLRGFIYNFINTSWLDSHEVGNIEESTEWNFILDSFNFFTLEITAILTILVLTIYIVLLIKLSINRFKRNN